jgi:hypothetical protein
MRTHGLILMLGCSFALGLAGCTRGGPGKAVPTSGTVVLESGEPLANANVTFNSVSGGPMSFGKTDAQGRFSLTTADGKEGAYPGQYTITLLVTGSVGEADKNMVSSEKAILKERDRLTRLPKTKIHANYGNAAKTPLKADIPAKGDVKLTVTKNGT